MEGENELIGKDVSIFYNDASPTNVSRKDGIVTSNSDIEICLDNRIIIPKSRIIRIEIVTERRR